MNDLPGASLDIIVKKTVFTLRYLKIHWGNTLSKQMKYVSMCTGGYWNTKGKVSYSVLGVLENLYQKKEG